MSHKNSFPTLRVAGIALASALAALLLWAPLQVNENSHMRTLMTFAARSVSFDLQQDTQTRLHAQSRMGELLSMKQGMTRRSWESYARLFLDDYPEYMALQWVGSDYKVRWTVPRHGMYSGDALPGPGESVRDVVAKAFQGGDRAAVTPPFLLRDGTAAMRIIVKVYDGEQPVGYMIGLVDAQDFFTALLAEYADVGYGAAVFQNGKEDYRMRGGDAAIEAKWGQESDVHVPGAVWHIRVWPYPELMSKIHSYLPTMAAAGGALLGLLLALTAYFAQAAQSQSNQLRRTRDELEVRVQERTAELLTVNKQLEAEVVQRGQAEDSLRQLSGRLLKVQDEERRRIARELHDSTAQGLSVVAMNLHRIQDLTSGNERAQALLGDSCGLLEDCTGELRTLSYLLHPPLLEEFGLECVLQWYVGGFSERTGIHVALDVQPELGRLPADQELTVFRIVQEGLTNVQRHSHSETASIILYASAESLTLEIADQGTGIPAGVMERNSDGVAQLGVGIEGMRERVRQLGGFLEVKTGDTGTRIQAVLPLPANAAKAPEESESLGAVAGSDGLLG